MIKKISKSQAAKIILGLFILALFWAVAYLTAPLFSDPQQVRDTIHRFGPRGPLIFIIMQIFQVFFAPIPGQTTGIVGGYLFGPIWGLVYTVIGSTIGFALILFLTRKIGRPFVEYFVGSKNLDRFDHLTGRKGALIFFLIFLLPAFPDDLISFIAGLTKIRIRTLILVSILGRFPGYLVLTLIGNGLATEASAIFWEFLTLLIIFLAVVLWKRKQIKEFIYQNDPPKGIVSKKLKKESKKD